MSRKPNKKFLAEISDVDPLDNSEYPRSSEVSPDFVPLDEPDALDALFDGLPNTTVQLYRQAPLMYAGDRIAGYLCDLDPHCDLAWINANYGGGTYVLRKKVRGRFTQQRTVEIAGRPRLDPPGVAGAAVPIVSPMASAGSRALANVGADVAYKGIPLTGSNAEFLQMVERLALIRHYLPEPKDVNTDLLKMLLEKQADTGLEGILNNMEKARELIDRLQPGDNGGESGSILNLIAKGLDTFKALLEKRAPGPGPVPIPSGSISSAVPVDLENVPGTELLSERPANVPENIPSSGEEKMPSFKDMANQGCSIIVDSFMSDPTDPDPGKLISVTVDMVKMQLPTLTPEVKAEMIKNKAVLNGIARLILNERYETDPQLVQNFNLFFDRVLDILTGESKT